MYDLDDIKTDTLINEIARRKRCQNAGMCWYCGKPLAEHACRLRDRADVRPPEPPSRPAA
jgi:hypothetical protein